MFAKQRNQISSTQFSLLGENRNYLSIVYKDIQYILVTSSSTILQLKERIPLNSPKKIQTVLRTLELSKDLKKERHRIEPYRTDIQSVTLVITQGCNLRCSYCFAGNGDYGRKSQMDFDTAKKTINYFSYRKKSLEIIFFGGKLFLITSLLKKS